MTYWNFDSLNQEMERMENSIWGWLYLAHYVSLEPADAEAEAFLARLEEEGYLPPTVAWPSDAGLKMRLFLAPEGVYPVVISCNGMAIELRIGSGDCVDIKSPQLRRRLYQVYGDASFLIDAPAKLPRVTFEFLRLMALMGQEASTPEPGDPTLTN